MTNKHYCYLNMVLHIYNIILKIPNIIKNLLRYLKFSHIEIKFQTSNVKFELSFQKVIIPFVFLHASALYRVKFHDFSIFFASLFLLWIHPFPKVIGTFIFYVSVII